MQSVPAFFCDVSYKGSLLERALVYQLIAHLTCEENPENTDNFFLTYQSYASHEEVLFYFVKR